MKTKMIARASMGIALLGLLAASPALAQKGSFEIGGGGGLMFLDAKLGDTGASLEARAGYFVTDRFQVEIQSSRASTILDGSFSAHTLNAVYHFEISGDAVPYILVGAGTADVEMDAPAEPTDDGTALRAAVGGRFWLGERQRASIRVEVSALTEDSFGHDSTHVGIIGTFGWRFGG